MFILGSILLGALFAISGVWAGLFHVRKRDVGRRCVDVRTWRRNQLVAVAILTGMLIVPVAAMVPAARDAILGRQGINGWTIGFGFITLTWCVLVIRGLAFWCLPKYWGEARQILEDRRAESNGNRGGEQKSTQS